MRKRSNITKILVLSVSIIAVSCGYDNDTTHTDPCAGPVPCLIEDWELPVPPHFIGCTFEDEQQNPVLVYSDGDFVTVAITVLWNGIRDYWVTAALKGPLASCYTSQFEGAEVDLDRDGISDYVGPATGMMEICGETLTVSDVTIDDYPYPDVYAAFVMPQIIPPPVPNPPPPPEPPSEVSIE